LSCQKAENSAPQAPAPNSVSDRTGPDTSSSARTKEGISVDSKGAGAVKAKGDATPRDAAEQNAAALDTAGKEETAAKKTSVGPEAQDRIIVARFTAVQNGAPAGWVVDLKKGSDNFSVERDGTEIVLHMVSRNNSFGIKKEAHINIRDYPYLNWRWKAVRMPPGGDVRNARTDDQAIQLYIAFPAIGWPAALNSPVIGYVWDNESPRGYYGRCKQIGGDKLRYLVLRNKSDKLGEWQAEKRNVYQDYKTLFRDIKSGEPDAVTHGLQIHINSQHTGTEAESYIGEIYFSKS
jgi:hypothetical protein